MLTVRFGHLTVDGLSVSKIRSPVGCFQDLPPVFNLFLHLRMYNPRVALMFIQISFFYLHRILFLPAYLLVLN
jgi:hypothetical protein